MKKVIIFIAITFAFIAFQSCNSVPFKSIKADNRSDSLSYMIGISVGHSIKMQQVEDIDAKLVAAGIVEVLESDSATTMQEANAFLQTYFTELRAQQAQENAEKGRQFLEDNKNVEGVVELESGLQYKVLVEGTGASPTEADRVKCHYRGKLLNGEEFDSSYERGQPAEFGLSGVIRGWTEGLQYMKEGGKYELYIPGELAYGPRGGGAKIGPNETLIFEIELLEVIKSEE
jgi:FKBP-type peptidyl-prolyl cis-trans isomerase